MRARVQVLNAMLDPLTEAETVDAVFRTLESGGRGWVCTVNVSMLMAMRSSAPLQSFADRAMLAVADGQPLVWCAPLFGGRLPERVTGIDLMDSLCRRAAQTGRQVYLLGASERILARALHGLRERHPGLRIEGAHGYFAAEEAACRVAQIRASGASLLFVGMGSPRQEAFIAEHWERLGVNVAIPVGGSFDVAGGAVMRAPRWTQRLGLEWLVRLLQEPRRLLPRYLVTNTRFCLLILETVALRLRRWAMDRLT
jgi:N-acetylglucosaminyldiphosphoundecaprenol N-acetyl-beta-D-mannosaminyltransferase